MVVKRQKLVNGCTYEITTGTVSNVVRVLDHNPVDGLHTVIVDGKTLRIDLSKALVRRHRTRKKTSTNDVYLYMCDLGNGLFKIGASASPQRRQKQIKTCSGRAVMRATARIPTQQSAAFRSFEKAVLQRFAHAKTAGGTEVLRLTSYEASDCATFMRSICARA